MALQKLVSDGIECIDSIAPCREVFPPAQSQNDRLLVMIFRTKAFEADVNIRTKVFLLIDLIYGIRGSPEINVLSNIELAPCVYEEIVPPMKRLEEFLRVNDACLLHNSAAPSPTPTFRLEARDPARLECHLYCFSLVSSLQYLIFQIPLRSMNSASSLSTAAVCAENIALLSLLHSVPVPPSSNNIDRLPIHQRNYVLSFAREKNLASTLAFLSNTKDSPKHIPALCIEEKSDSASLAIMLAVNKTSCEDGNELLQGLKQSFEKIFTILSEIPAERNKSQAMEHRVFTAIVSMCSHRLICRLRFVAKKRGTPKQSLRWGLEEAINSLKQLDKGLLCSLPVGPFIERAKNVVRLADSWVKHQTLAELENLVEGISQLKQIGNLKALMDSIPNRAMCPSSRQNIVNIVSKVSRYREAARFLYRTARRIPALRRAKVVLVNLPSKAFCRISDENHTPQLASTIARANAYRQAPDVSYLCRLLNTSETQLNDQFVSQTKKTLREARIHAEIQLIYHYELNPSTLPPRVVCSSKDACFLCNAFILMHGKIHTPRQHGRLYPGWKLPLIPNMNDLGRRLNSVLENQIISSLGLLLSRQKKTVYPYPNESTLLTLPLSTSTLRTSVIVEPLESEEKSAKEALPDETAGYWEHSVPPRDRVSDLSPKDMESVRSALDSKVGIEAEEGEARETDSLNQSILSSRCSPQTICPNVTTSDSVELVQGVPQVNSIVTTREPQFHTAGNLEIHIEYTTETVSGTNRSNLEMVYSIEWLSIEDTRGLLEQKPTTIVDVNTLQNQTSHELDNDSGLLIMAGGVFVRITPRHRP